MNTFTEQEVLNDLKIKIEQAGTQREYAQRIGVSQAFLSRVLNRRDPLSDRILSDLGYIQLPERIYTLKQAPDTGDNTKNG